MSIEPIVVPKWGMAMDEGTLTGWLVENGTAVSAGQEIAEVETTKIANAIEASASGILYQAADVGSIVPVGGLLAVIAVGGASAEEANAYIAANRSDAPARKAEAEKIDPTRTVDVDGLSIRYLEAGEGGTPVVFVHGFGADLNTWMFNQGTIAAHQRTISLDLPGHGASSKSVGDGDVPALARVVGRFLETIGVARAHFVGHSLGGAVCLQLALDKPNLVASLTLVAPAGIGENLSDAFLQGFIGETRARKLEPVLAMLVANPELVTAQMVEDVLRAKRLDGALDALRTIAGNAFPQGRQAARFDTRLGELSAPVSIVVGADDQIIPASQAAALSNVVPVRLEAGVGHLAHMERPEVVNAAILQVAGI